MVSTKSLDSTHPRHTSLWGWRYLRGPVAEQTAVASLWCNLQEKAHHQCILYRTGRCHPQWRFPQPRHPYCRHKGSQADDRPLLPRWGLWCWVLGTARLEFLRMMIAASVVFLGSSHLGLFHKIVPYLHHNSCIQKKKIKKINLHYDIFRSVDRL